MKDFKIKVSFAQFFALLNVLIGIGYLWWISYMGFFYRMPMGISDIKIAIIGWVGACIGYIVGSTFNSSKKDDVLREAMKSKRDDA